MNVQLAELLIPVLSWRAGEGFAASRALVDRALALGVGGFLIEGGEPEAVRTLTRDLRKRSKTPLLIAADMERGAGQQVAGATGLPPLGALASLADADAIRRAARLTAKEARTLGINWLLAPVADLDLSPDNPIVGTRAAGGDPAVVAQVVRTWIEACQSEGVLATAKHFPGHGRTLADSHLLLPRVDLTEDELRDTDLLPFRAAMDAGVAALMTAHVAFPELDPSGAPATCSKDLIGGMLRTAFGYDGLVVSDALGMAAVLDGATEGEAAVMAATAGCDLLLAPADLDGVLAALARALDEHVLDAAAVQRSLRRRRKWAQWASSPDDFRKPSTADIQWGVQLTDRVIHIGRGMPPLVRAPLEIAVVDDDAGAPGVPSREPLFEALRAAGVQARQVEVPTPSARSTFIIALFGEVRAAKGRTGYTEATLQRVDQLSVAARRAGREAMIFQFGDPRWARSLPGDLAIACAWGGEAGMQAAAARWLVLRRGR
jgi:beta-glucosidase-like glycosyl hydrolase